MSNTPYASRFEALAGGRSEYELDSLYYGEKEISLRTVKHVIDNMGTAQELSGYLQEAGLSAFLRNLNLENTKIYNSFILDTSQKVYEVDNLIVTGHGIYIYEAKSIQGEISGDTSEPNWRRVLRDDGTGVEYKFNNPIKSLDIKKTRLEEIINFSLPIYKVVVLSSFTKLTISNFTNEKLDDLIICTDTELEEKLKEHIYNQETHKEKTFNNVIKILDKYAIQANRLEKYYLSYKEDQKKKKRFRKKYNDFELNRINKGYYISLSKTRRSHINTLIQAYEGNRLELPIVSVLDEYKKFEFVSHLDLIDKAKTFHNHKGKSPRFFNYQIKLKINKKET